MSFYRLGYKKTKLDDKHEIINTPLFPKNIQYRKNFRYSALIGVGSNIKKPLERFKKLYFFLRKETDIELACTYPILKNPPFGYLNQPDFYNTLMELRTNLPPKALLKRLLRIESKFGRKRSFKNAPRTLDLDIIFFENFVMYNKSLKLPHPEWANRASVLVPMSYQRSKLKWKK